MVDKRLADKEYRMANFYKIVDKNQNLIFFDLNDTQRELYEKRHTRNIILKARQLGITTFACIDILDNVLFKNNFTAVIIAHDLESLKKIFKKIKIAWDNFPEELKQAIGWKETTDSANELSFNNGSSVRVALSSRADTVSQLHISEFGKICSKYPQKAEEIITGAIPSVPENGIITIESTAEGESGHFYDMFWEAWDNPPQTKKEFKAFFFPWTKDPIYKLKGEYDIPKELLDYQKRHKLTDEQINWYYIEQKTLKSKMKQENPTNPDEAFEGSGNKLFNIELLNKQKVKEGEIFNDWIYYDDYIPGHRYGLGADVAEGVGQDSSTIVVIDFTPLKPKVVAEYSSNKIPPDIFAFEIKSGGTRYGNCIAGVERNNHGFATLTKLKEIYSNIYSSKTEQTELGQMGGTIKLGWHTNSATKPKMLFELNDAINEDCIELQSEKIIRELKTYDQEDLSQINFSDKQTKHWDLVIALAICWQMRVRDQEIYNLKTRY